MNKNYSDEDFKRDCDELEARLEREDPLWAKQAKLWEKINEHNERVKKAMIIREALIRMIDDQLFGHLYD